MRTQLKKKKRNGMSKPLRAVLITTCIMFGLFLACCIFLLLNISGRRILYQIAAKQIHSALEVETPHPDEIAPDETFPEIKNDYSTQGIENFRTYLIFGIEEIEGAKNTDSMMLVTLNLKEGKIKLTSLMRDTYVEIPGYYGTKLNTSYALGGPQLLMNTIEKNYKIDIDGYAWVNFDAFEKVIDLLGGIEIQLTSGEAEYLNTTNYISNPAYRNVSAGKNLLNGNQTLGYCRIRYRATSSGSNNDYGRTERQRTVLNAVFNKYKKQNILDLINISYQCLQYVKTNVSSDEIAKILEALVENHIPDLDTMRIPIDGFFSDPAEYKGTTYPLVLEWDENIKHLYMFMYDESEEAASERLSKISE